MTEGNLHIADFGCKASPISLPTYSPGWLHTHTDRHTHTHTHTDTHTKTHTNTHTHTHIHTHTPPHTHTHPPTPTHPPSLSSIQQQVTPEEKKIPQLTLYPPLNQSVR